MYDARRRLQASPDDAWEAVSATDQIDWSDAERLSLGEVPWGRAETSIMMLLAGLLKRQAVAIDPTGGMLQLGRRPGRELKTKEARRARCRVSLACAGQRGMRWLAPVLIPRFT